MALIKATVLYESRFWVGTFERTDKEGYAIARHIFGAEPSDAEVYEFIINHYSELNFGSSKQVEVQIQRMNPKRVQREVRREMEKIKISTKPSTFAQDYMREELEKKKLLKNKSKADKQARDEAQFNLRQQKKKEKQRGH